MTTDNTWTQQNPFHIRLFLDCHRWIVESIIKNYIKSKLNKRIDSVINNPILTLRWSREFMYWMCEFSPFRFLLWWIEYCHFFVKNEQIFYQKLFLHRYFLHPSSTVHTKSFLQNSLKRQSLTKILKSEEPFVTLLSWYCIQGQLFLLWSFIRPNALNNLNPWVLFSIKQPWILEGWSSLILRHVFDRSMILPGNL